MPNAIEHGFVWPEPEAVIRHGTYHEVPSEERQRRAHAHKIEVLAAIAQSERGPQTNMSRVVSAIEALKTLRSL